MPRQPTTEEERFDEIALPEQTLGVARPVVRARVVYLGADRKKSVTFPGQVSVELVEDPAGTAVRDNGHRLARQLYQKEYIDLGPEEKAEVDKQKVERTYKEIKQPVDAGNTSYDFSLHDAAGNLIRERLMPDTAPQHLRGKRFEWVEHIEHLRRFFLATGANKEREFEVLTKPEHMQALSDYIRRSQRGRATKDAELAEIQTGARY